MKQTIVNLIENESENTKLDFKREQYPIEKGEPKKGEFLKDMCSFANLVSTDDKFIIIGVEEENGIATGFKSIDKLHDQASYQQFLNQYIEPEINFEYNEIHHQGYRLAYFRLFDNNKKPYLFKNEYKDIQSKEIHYRIGTGFVRTGASTRGLKRDDFEKIYSDRFAIKDRSNEIEFEVTLGGFNSTELRSTIYRHLQVDVKNLSNASIDLDVEAKVYNDKGVRADCTQDIERKIFEDKRSNSMFAYTEYADRLMPPNLIKNTNVGFEKYVAYSTYEIIPKQGTHTAICVKQKGVQTNIFNDQIALVFSRPAEVKIELVVRSNDFPAGPRTFLFSITEAQTEQFLDPWDL